MMNVSHTRHNSLKTKTHRRENFWQITFPLTLGILLILGMAGWVVAAAVNSGNVSQPADASLIFLILPTMAMAVFPLVLLAGFAYGVIWLNKNITPYLRQAQDAMITVRDGVKTGADKLVEPILRFKSTMAAFEALKRKK